MSSKKHYRPLPDCVTIKKSGIHGLGLYTTQKIDAGTIIGITHVKDERFEDGYIRTPLGGFFNHSETPNSEAILDGNFIYLKTLVDIEPDVEITVTYFFYNPEKNSNEITAAEFLDLIKKECDEAGVKYFFPEEKNVPYPGNPDMKVSGYFDDIPEPVLACAIGKPESEWYEILVHESCHMEQWKEKSEMWINCRRDGIDCDKGMDDWLGGKDFHEDEYTYYIRTMQDVEIDCEKRSVEKIKRLGLPIDVKGYIKRANSYLFFYSVLLQTRKWSDIPPYNVPEIVELMPDFFSSNIEDYYEVPEKLLNLYKQKCYEI